MRNQNIIIICSYNIDLTRNAGNCLFKMLENKSSIFLYSVIYFVSYESEFCGLYRLKNGKVGLSRKRDNVSNSGYVRKWKTLHCL